MTKIQYQKVRNILKNLTAIKAICFFMGIILVAIYFPVVGGTMQQSEVANETKLSTFIGLGLAYADVSTSVELFGSQGQASLEVTKSVDNLTPLPGDIITYTITAKNNGTASSNGLWIKDTVPENTTFVSCDPSGTYGATALGEEYVNWFIGVLAPGDQVLLAMKVKINECVSGTAIENTALYEETSNFPGNPDINPGTGKTNSVRSITGLGETPRIKGFMLATGDTLLLVAGCVSIVGVTCFLLAACAFRKKKKQYLHSAHKQL